MPTNSKRPDYIKMSPKELKDYLDRRAEEAKTPKEALLLLLEMEDISRILTKEVQRLEHPMGFWRKVVVFVILIAEAVAIGLAGKVITFGGAYVFIGITLLAFNIWKMYNTLKIWNSLP